jgi:hypothetical protein
LNSRFGYGLKKPPGAFRAAYQNIRMLLIPISS